VRVGCALHSCMRHLRRLFWALQLLLMSRAVLWYFDPQVSGRAAQCLQLLPDCICCLLLPALCLAGLFKLPAGGALQ
jgi:hypothetical protein